MQLYVIYLYFIYICSWFKTIDSILWALGQIYLYIYIIHTHFMKIQQICAAGIGHCSVWVGNHPSALLVVTGVWGTSLWLAWCAKRYQPSGREGSRAWNFQVAHKAWKMDVERYSNGRHGRFKTLPNNQNIKKNLLITDVRNVTTIESKVLKFEGEKGLHQKTHSPCRLPFHHAMHGWFHKQILINLLRLVPVSLGP